MRSVAPSPRSRGRQTHGVPPSRLLILHRGAISTLYSRIPFYSHTATQEARARAIVDGEKKAKSARFVKTRGTDRSRDEANLARAQSLVGLKGYVTNVAAAVMPAAEVIAKYLDLWHVEKSLRVSKSDLRARPMFHYTRDAIEGT